VNKPLGRALILIPLLLIFLIGLFYLLRPSSTWDTSTTSVPVTNGSGETIDVAIREDTMNPEEITVNEGDLVILRLTSDSPVEFHVHGYDIYADVEPGEPAELAFDATITGRFAIENHYLDPAVSLGQILVQPR
jgi:heme/copper-type cytochrome/quinol oxidase subunit 2